MNIYEKLTGIQKALKASKKEKNDFGGYMYRTIESIFEGVKPLLDKYKTTLVLTDELVQVGERYYIKATAALFDCEVANGEPEVCVCSEAYAREPITKKGTDESQITGAATTYARKYALTGLFLLDNSEDDPDSEQYQKKIAKNTAKENKSQDERIAAYQDFIGTCKKAKLSAKKVAADLGLSGESTKEEYETATEGLKQLIDTNQDLSKWEV